MALFSVIITVLAFVLNNNMIMLANGDASVTNAPTCHATDNINTQAACNKTDPFYTVNNRSTAASAEFLTNSAMTASESNFLTDEWREAVDTMKVSAILQISLMTITTAALFIAWGGDEGLAAAGCANCLGCVLSIVALVFMCMYTKDMRDLTDVCAGFEPYEDSLEYMRMMWALFVVNIVVAAMRICFFFKRAFIHLKLDNLQIVIFKERFWDSE